ncbi:MAG: hypothetical protein KGZ97_03400 [Bacteroidetes bacterium]|nr:hypothetical protein [Bacteroidota bacterium]
MKKLEIIIAAVVLLSAALHLLNFPLISVLLYISVFLMSSFYYVLGFALFNGVTFKGLFKKESYKNTNAAKIIGAVIIGWALSVLIIGSLISMQKWPGGELMLLIGLILFATTFIVSGIFFLLKKDAYYTRVFTRVSFWGIIGALIYFIHFLN